ncbi:MAG TPA: alpha/beta fold hydrolase, partial [Gemmatimonadaceae bacterium]|nr:alpha/beta fold hydrolase [Gemmatimonadaceae bacterium]
GAAFVAPSRHAPSTPMPAMPLRRLRTAALALALAAATNVTRVTAQAPAQGDVLLLLRGNDTISIERVQRTRERLESELLLKGANARIRTRVDLDAEGRATRLSNEARMATADPAGPAMQQAEARFTGDSVIVDLTGGGRTVTQRFATQRGAVPFLNPSFAMVELIIQRARAIGGDSVEVPVWNLQGGTTAMSRVVRRGRDSVVVYLGNLPAHLAVDGAGAILGGTVPAQGIAIVRTRVGAAAMTMEKPDYSAPPGAPYTAEEVTVPTPQGHTLAGTLTLPAARTGKVAAVVTITGSGPEDRDEAIPPVKGYRPFRQIADTLGRHGIAVLRLDDRGFGASTGNHAAATSADFANDIRSALAYLRTRPEIDATRLALLGHSEGGLIAPMVAVDEPTLRGIVLMAGPSQTGRAILRYQLGNAIRRDSTYRGARRDSALKTVDATVDSLGRSSPWVRFFLDHDPLVTARRVKVPTLILQGATDQQVTAEQAAALEQAMRAGGNRRVTRRVFADANHLFVQDPDGNPANYASLPQRQVRSDVLAALLAWLQGVLR